MKHLAQCLSNVSTQEMLASIIKPTALSKRTFLASFLELLQNQLTIPQQRKCQGAAHQKLCELLVILMKNPRTIMLR